MDHFAYVSGTFMVDCFYKLKLRQPIEIRIGNCKPLPNEIGDLNECSISSFENL